MRRFAWAGSFAAAMGLLIAAVAAVAAAQAPALPDPSGEWTSSIGELSLMLSGDALSFTYAAVFGETAHTCEGAGVAKLAASGGYEYTDGQGTVVFSQESDRLRMEVSQGIASFCGAGWGHDSLRPAGPPALKSCSVVVERSHFHAVGSSPPEARSAYVARGDRVQAVQVHVLDRADWLLARFIGPRSTTVGLLRVVDLDCGKATAGGEQ